MRGRSVAPEVREPHGRRHGSEATRSAHLANRPPPTGRRSRSAQAREARGWLPRAPATGGGGGAQPTQVGGASAAIVGGWTDRRCTPRPWLDAPPPPPLSLPPSATACASRRSATRKAAWGDAAHPILHAVRGRGVHRGHASHPTPLEREREPEQPARTESRQEDRRPNPGNPSPHQAIYTPGAPHRE